MIITGINGVTANSKTGDVCIDVRTKDEPSILLVAKQETATLLMNALTMLAVPRPDQKGF